MAQPALDSQTRIAITGGAGLIGGILRRTFADEYADRYSVTALDLKGDPGQRIDAVDSTDANGLAAAFRDHDVVIDLAAGTSSSLAWQPTYDNNIPSAYNALQAAQAAGVRRVVFASSNHATGAYENDAPYRQVVTGDYTGLQPGSFDRISADSPIRPDGPYGIAKAFGELAGRYYAEYHGVSVLCLRIGTVNAAGRPQTIRQLATLLTHGDLLRLVVACIEAPADRMFGIYYGVSANTWRIWDIDVAAAEIGYQPQDDAERWRTEVQQESG